MLIGQREERLRKVREETPAFIWVANPGSLGKSSSCGRGQKQLESGYSQKKESTHGFGML